MMTAHWVIGMTAAVLWAGQVAAQTTITAGPAVAAVAVAAPPQAKVETSLGTFTIMLDRTNAPKSVANFISYAKERHFDGTTIYRIAPGFVIQMGSIEANGNSRPVHAPIPLESANGLKNVRGTLSMARQSAPATATAEFFVNLADNPDLDPDAGAAPNTTGYAVFGRVSDGMDVVDKIAAVPLGGAQGPFPPSATPMSPVLIKKVTVIDSPGPNPPPFAR
jgi:cyclophilin family peptidyl-prolyl cis-trans isomerase